MGDHRRALTACSRPSPCTGASATGADRRPRGTASGYARHHLGDYDRAVTCYHRGIDLLRDLGDRYFETATLTHLGETHRSAGDMESARTAWRQALDILDDLSHPDADQVRAKLAALDNT